MNATSLVNTPIAEAYLLMFSKAYSTYYSLPSGEKVVVLESYLLDIFQSKYI